MRSSRPPAPAPPEPPAEPEIPAALDGLLGYHLRRAQVRLFQHFRQQLGHLGITPGQAGMLMVIRHNPGISQTALARSFGIERATLGAVVDYLEQQGWVARAAHASDKRVKALYLTPAGERFLDALLPAIEQHERTIQARLSPAEAQSRRRLLRKLVTGR